MRSVSFTPNYLKKGNACDKNGATKGREPKKKRTVIEGAIKTADEVEGRLAKTKKGTGVTPKAKGRTHGRKPKLSGVRREGRLPGRKPGTQKGTLARGKDQP